MAFFNSGKLFLRTVLAGNRRCVKRGVFSRLIVILLLTLVSATATADEQRDPFKHSPDQCIFLVATEQLTHSSFKETVILITHHSERGATGLAVNRPSEFPLNEVFPEVQELHNYRDEVYLGGPVSTRNVFVLMRTQRPHAKMYNIAKDLYFTAGVNALVHGLKNIKQDEHARAYVGYTGWAPGQLEHEIQRGDWLVVHADPDIVFDLDHRAMWKKLYKSWSGQWI